MILWVTSMVDNDSSNYQEAYDNGYFIRYEYDHMCSLHSHHAHTLFSFTCPCPSPKYHTLFIYLHTPPLVHLMHMHTHTWVPALDVKRDIFGKQALFKWWHGAGGLLDYTNEEAVLWWHGQIDQVGGYCLKKALTMGDMGGRCMILPVVSTHCISQWS